MNSESTHFVTLGYGFHLLETRLMLDLAVRQDNRTQVKEACLLSWSQASRANKERMWNQLSQRYLEIEGDRIHRTPFLQMYQKLQSDREKLDLIFYQLCRTTPLLLEALRLLARDTLLYTGEASFTKYHLDQMLSSIFGRITKSTSERVRQILREAGRLELEDKTYIAKSGCPCEAVLAYGIYADAENQGWRAPSSQTLVNESDIAAAFLCTRTRLIQALQQLAANGYCEYHRHGSTDQIHLVYTNLQEFVDAWDARIAVTTRTAASTRATGWIN